jgi:hypothetical protein
LVVDSSSSAGQDTTDSINRRHIPFMISSTRSLA